MRFFFIILLCRYVYSGLPCLDRISRWQQRLRCKMLFLLLVLLSVCVSSEQVSALRTWAIAYEKPHATFTDEVLLHELHICIYTRHLFTLFSSPQDIASHQPKELVARIERNEWSGKLHLGRFEARIVLVKVFCCVFSPWSGSQAIFVACLRRGRFAISFFFCLRRALSVFSYIFF